MPSKTWQIFPLIRADMPFQMALDEILFRRAENGAAALPGPCLRFYFSAGSWLTTGFSQPSPSVPDAGGMRICKRITGGGCVLHGEDVIFSLVARKTDDDSFTTVRASYLKIHTALKSAFGRLGREARFYRCTENLPAGPDCFRFPIASDLAIGRQKAAGGAQKRSAGAMLHQESVRVPNKVAWEALVDETAKAMAEEFKVTIEKADLDPEWLIQAGKLAREKYQPRDL